MATKQFSQVVESFFLAILLCGALTQVGCFNFTSFPVETENELILSQNSRVFFNAIQITPDLQGDLVNFSGRVFYKNPFRLWSKSKGVTASFGTKFVLRIKPVISSGGEGLAFILAADTTLPEASQGQWLGIVNAGTNGSSQADVVAVEFDTRKSYPEDLDENHVGLDVNSIYSIKQVSLTGYGVNLSSNSDITAQVEYDGITKTVVVSVSNGTGGLQPIISLPLNLSDLLPENVFVGFSASTGIYTELNCIRSWELLYWEDINGDEDQLWIWITVPAVVLILIGIMVYLYYLQRKRRERPEDAYPRIEDQIEGDSSVAPRKFKLKELRKATGNFNPRNKLGKGGFGTVYKGFLANKLEVAVKRVSKDSTHGKQEFVAEVTTIGSLHHKNLVKLIGWCYERRELLLVYEFMPNGSLDKFIYVDDNLGMEEQNLSWEKRHVIIYGVAQALDYLHNGCAKRVLHRDIKPSNIMLDSDFNARLGDFGLARTVQQRGKTHHTTNEIAGTPGYMAPETFLVGRATVETDIYAFGVLVLEVVCGRKPGKQINEQNDYNNGIVYWMWELHRRERILDAVDPRLDEKFDEERMKWMLVLGLVCCHPNPHHRPSMKTVLQVLTGEAPLPLVPNERPAFVWPAMPPSFKHNADDVSLIGSQLSPFTRLDGR